MAFLMQNTSLNLTPLKHHYAVYLDYSDEMFPSLMVKPPPFGAFLSPFPYLKHPPVDLSLCQ